MEVMDHWKAAGARLTAHTIAICKGLRPFGVSFLYAGYDEHFGFQLYHSDPSGNYSGWKATCIGANSSNAQSILKQDYKEEMSLKEAKSLAIKVLHKTMDTTTMGSDKCESSVSAIITFL